MYVNLGEPDRAQAVSKLPVDGVGLLRAEFMILSALGGTHPRQLLQEGRGSEFVERMATDLLTFAAAFAPRPVIYRSMDFRTNEFRGLHGGEQFEPAEQNPMIGFRGCFRNIQQPDLFGLETRLQWVEAHWGVASWAIPAPPAACLVDGDKLTRRAPAREIRH